LLSKTQMQLNPHAVAHLASPELRAVLVFARMPKTVNLHEWLYAETEAPVACRSWVSQKVCHRDPGSTGKPWDFDRIVLPLATFDCIVGGMGLEDDPHMQQVAHMERHSVGMVPGVPGRRPVAPQQEVEFEIGVENHRRLVKNS
jgi:hypothetical protein